MNWPIFGDLVNPLKLAVPLAADMARELNVWQLDRLPSRLPELRAMLQAESTGPAQIFYVHCEAGLDRTGEVCGSYYMQYKGMTLQQALDVRLPVLPPPYWLSCWHGHCCCILTFTSTPSWMCRTPSESCGSCRYMACPGTVCTSNTRWASISSPATFNSSLRHWWKCNPTRIVTLSVPHDVWTPHPMEASVSWGGKSHQLLMIMSQSLQSRNECSVA